MVSNPASQMHLHGGDSGMGCVRRFLFTQEPLPYAQNFFPLNFLLYLFPGHRALALDFFCPFENSHPFS